MENKTAAKIQKKPLEFPRKNQWLIGNEREQRIIRLLSAEKLVYILWLRVRCRAYKVRNRCP